MSGSSWAFADTLTIDVCAICRASDLVAPGCEGTGDDPCWHLAELEDTPVFDFVAPLLIQYLTTMKGNQE